MIYRQFLTILMLALLSGVVVSCGPIYSTDYEFKPPHSASGKQCVNKCLQQKSQCKSDCKREYRSCRENARLAALPQYYIYVQQQQKNNKPIDKSVDNFADYSNCHQDCGCDQDYRECYSNCGGHIIPHKKCVAFCDQADD